jgi:hypothetical protein
VLTWIRLPDGDSMVGNFNGALRAGVIIIIDGVEYVIEDVGHIATDQTPRSRRHGKVREFVPVVYLKPRAPGARSGAHSSPVDARSKAA